MRLFPKTASEWANLLLFPFKAYTAVAYFMGVMAIDSLPRRADYTDIGATIFVGYLLCFGVLLLGALIQKFAASRRDYLITCAFAAADFGFLVMLLRYLART